MNYNWNEKLMQYYESEYNTTENPDDYYSDITEEYEKYEYEDGEQMSKVALLGDSHFGVRNGSEIFDNSFREFYDKVFL